MLTKKCNARTSGYFTPTHNAIYAHPLRGKYGHRPDGSSSQPHSGAVGHTSILKQIKCPPTPKKKNIQTFVKKWLPAMQMYAFDYTGVSNIIGVKTKKKKKKRTIVGSNKFVKLSGQCDSRSEYGCRGQDRYAYLRTYPTGKFPLCKKANSGAIPVGSRNIVGGYGSYWWHPRRYIPSWCRNPRCYTIPLKPWSISLKHMHEIKILSTHTHAYAILNRKGMLVNDLCLLSGERPPA